MASKKYVQALTQYLSGAGVIVGATSLVLTSLKDIYGNPITSVTSFGDKGYITLEPDTVNEEAATFTGLAANANGTVTLSGVSTVLAQSPYTESSGLVRAHSGGTKVVITDNVAFWNTFTNKNNDETVGGQWTFLNTPIVPGVVSDASTTVKGVTKLSVAPVLASNPIAVGVNDTSIFAPLSAQTPTGIISPYAGRTAPTSWLLCDGSAVSRSTYAALLAVIAPSQAVTVTIASPAVFSATTHGLVAGDKIHFTTTGALPTGLATNTDYYVIAAGLTANAFEVALSPAGSAVNTSGTQSGVHTVYASAWGKGDGSTTFNLPDLRAKMPVGLAATAPTTTLDFQGAQRSSNVITILNTVFPAQGQKVQLTTTGALPTGLSAATDYWIIRVSSTSISFASTQANANAGTAIVLSGDGSGVNTMTFTNLAHTTLGRNGGEENHGVAITEMAAHTHGPPGAATNLKNTGSGAGGVASANEGFASFITSSTGGDTQHNNMQPFAVTNYIIKI